MASDSLFSPILSLGEDGEHSEEEGGDEDKDDVGERGGDEKMRSRGNGGVARDDVERGEARGRDEA